jgi:Caspase domain
MSTVSGQRKALIIASDDYEQEGLRRLQAPAADAVALRRVLGDPEIGDFAVQVVHNQPAHIIQAQIEDFLSDARPEDLLLLHFSCHGLKSESGELFFAACNTRPNRLASTAIPADFVQRCLRTSRSRSIVLLLDCCYGGAFSQGVRVRAAGDIDVLDSFAGTKQGSGRGRAVITASSAMEYAFEGERLASDQDPQPSIFTKAIVDGLSTGDADLDEDGRVSLDELYEYVFDKVQQGNPHQTPSRDFEMQGDLYVAHSRRRRIRATPLPPDLDAARKDQNMYTRRGAVTELRARLLSDNLSAALGAWEALAELANDIGYIADEANAALHEAAVHPAETELQFKQLEQGSQAPHQTIHLLGPPIARACRADTSHECIHVKQLAEGFDISIDTIQAGAIKGSLHIKGPTGDAAVTIQANISPTPPQVSISKPSAGAIPASPEATFLMRETAPTTPPARHAMPTARAEPSVAPPKFIAVESGRVTSPVPRLARGMSVLSVFWTLLPVLSLGILTPILAPIPSAHAAVKLHDRKLWLISAAYGISSLTLWILWVVEVSKRWNFAYITYTGLLAVGIIATIHAFRLRRRVFVSPLLSASTRLDSSHTTPRLAPAPAPAPASTAII